MQYYMTSSIFQLFKEFGLLVVLKGVVTWSVKDEIAIPKGNDAISILRSFKEYINTYQSGTSFDAALLIS